MCICTSEALLSFREVKDLVYDCIPDELHIRSVIALVELGSRTFRTNVGYSMSFNALKPMLVFSEASG